MGSVLTQDEAVLKRIWGADYEGVYRVFMSHTYEHKAVAIELKEHLDVYGIRGFVDHVSIRPSQEWSTEIESALSSMDALVALLTEDFHGSEWTDQEIGYALARESKVRLIPVDLGQAPYGFIKKYQALPIQQGSSDSEADWQNAAREIVKVCIEDDRVLDAYVEAVRNCSNFEKANDLYEILPSISSMSKQQEDALISAFNLASSQ